MPIRLSCLKCQKTLRIDDRFAGRTVKCPSCTTALKVPATEVPVPAVPSDDSFGFGSASAGSGRQEFEFDGSGGEGQQVTRPAGVVPPEWLGLHAGLNLVWLGSALQACAMVLLFLGVIILVVTGMGYLLEQYNTDRANFQRTARETGTTLVWIMMGVGGLASLTSFVGFILRLVGFIRCLFAPSESGAVLPAVGCLLGEILPIPVIGLACLLWLIGQISSSLQSKILPGKIVSFLIWSGITILVMVVTIALYLIPDTAKLLTRNSQAINIFRGIIVIHAGLGIVLVVKYLGMLSIAADEIRRRAGRVPAAS